MDFVIMVLLADSAAAGFLIFSFTASILILFITFPPFNKFA